MLSQDTDREIRTNEDGELVVWSPAEGIVRVASQHDLDTLDRANEDQIVSE